MGGRGRAGTERIRRRGREDERKNGVWGMGKKRKDVYRHIRQSQYMYDY